MERSKWKYSKIDMSYSISKSISSHPQNATVARTIEIQAIEVALTDKSKDARLRHFQPPFVACFSKVEYDGLSSSKEIILKATMTDMVDGTTGLKIAPLVPNPNFGEEGEPELISDPAFNANMPEFQFIADKATSGLSIFEEIKGLMLAYIDLLDAQGIINELTSV